MDRVNYLKSLGPGEWVDDIAVDSYCTLVHWWQSTFRLTGEGKPASLIMPANLSQKIKIDKVKDTEKTVHAGYTNGIPYGDILAKRSLNPFEHLHTIIPFLTGENHWVTAVIDMKSRTIYVFDSMRDIDAKESEGRCKAVFMSVRRWISEFEKAINRKDPDRMEIDDGAEVEVAEWKSRFPRALTQQKNYHDCGVMMLQTIMNVCRLQSLEAVAFGFSDFVEENGSTMDRMSPDNIDNDVSFQTREKMSIELLQQKLLLRTLRDDRPAYVVLGESAAKTSTRSGFWSPDSD
ncbi:hypothetical protein FFLO_02636 [Filobasidium floriforme]|uniref:Ubiquitin-like protease family profile domain-containing protein n=1 Tax=Filobasidium floriforme TaxID=5210 RepID=A0A8K0JMW1_9TREE|nr:uncharacterized protein HD553DRAFT_303884 [Filobasidium floriforme]KAG7561907.1 hypothetical protein FFLO_02636 [Filobasidium floriforme]KAH8089388.1 hypothetical protein HD553DRAFT_303884 [Filobasidium floriforme]